MEFRPEMGDVGESHCTRDRRGAAQQHDRGWTQRCRVERFAEDDHNDGVERHVSLLRRWVGAHDERRARRRDDADGATLIRRYARDLDDQRVADGRVNRDGIEASLYDLGRDGLTGCGVVDRGLQARQHTPWSQ